jgi:signal transduction histidine kinase
MKKIVILLITISSLFGWQKYRTDPTTIRQLYVLDETYIKHYSDELEWRNKHQVYFIHNMEQAMRKVKKGRYNKKTSQEIADLIQKYVDLEKFHREELKSLEKELTKLSK